MARIGMTFPFYFFVFITIIDRVNIFIFYFFTCSVYSYPHVMYTISFYEHLIFFTVPSIFVDVGWTRNKVTGLSPKIVAHLLFTASAVNISF